MQKPKNMKAAVSKLAAYVKKDGAMIITALVLAAAGAVLTIVGPNQISRITDYIYDGLTGGVSVSEIAEDVQKQLATGEISAAELAPYLPEGTDPSALRDLDLTDTDSELARAVLKNIRLSDDFATSHEGGGIDLDGVLSAALLLLGIYLVSALCNFLQHYIMATVTQKMSRRMRGDIDRKINRLPLKYFSENTYGDVLSRVTNDVDTIAQGLSSSTAQIVSSAAQFIGCLVMMFLTSAAMAGTTILTSILGIVLMFVIMTRSQRYFRARQTNLGALNGYIEEMYTGHDVIRIYGAEKGVREKFNSLNAAVKEANFKSQFLSGLMQPLMTFVGNLGYVAVCIAGAVLCRNGSITFGVITAFLIYIRLFESPLRQIAQSMTSMQSAAAAAERVFDFLAEEEMEDESGKTAVLAGTRGEVEFSHIRFAYPSDPDREIIHDFSVHVRPGQKVAIVGPTGAGKTTLVNLLMRFFEPAGGTIKIDGMDTAALTRANVHDQFGMVLQDTWIFEGTVRENLVYNCENVSGETVIAAAEACGIDRFIQALPEGYDTVISDSTAISAGQKQLFTIARAIIQNNPMLILDEATSSVDTRTEAITQSAMDHLTEQRTSFVIAHRLSTIRNADIILVLRDGNVVEQGDHESLLAQNGFYAELYHSQFESADL